MSGDSNIGAGDLGSGMDWIHENISQNLIPGARQLDEALGIKKGFAKNLVAPEEKTINPNLGAVAQVAALEQNIEGGFASGAIDTQTRDEMYNELRGGINATDRSYEDQSGYVAGLQGRLNTIASGRDPTVNDRIRLNTNIMTLKDRPGRAGLLTGG